MPKPAVSDLLGRPRLSVWLFRSIAQTKSNMMVHRGSFAGQQSPLYFDLREVKEAIHAPLDTSWTECSDVDVFPNGDQSLPSAFTVLPTVIEKNMRTVIVHGLADFRVIAEGYVLQIVCLSQAVGCGAVLMHETC